MSPTLEKPLSPGQVAIELGCSVKFVLAEIRSRRLTPVLRVNRRVIWVPRATVSDYKARKIA